MSLCQAKLELAVKLYAGDDSGFVRFMKDKVAERIIVKTRDKKTLYRLRFENTGITINVPEDVFKNTPGKLKIKREMVRLHSK